MDVNLAFLIAELTQMGYVIMITDEDVELTIDSRLYTEQTIECITNLLKEYRFSFDPNMKSIGEYEYFIKAKYFDKNSDQKNLNIFILLA